MNILAALAKEDLLIEVTNEVVGLHNIIDLGLDYTDSTPTNWHAEVTAEYINTVGGVNRTNIPFVFYWLEPFNKNCSRCGARIFGGWRGFGEGAGLKNL